ncbi:hypothetical protein STSP_59830 [Streptomyces jeddahensis]|uniref:Uncharacterized protein n=2 Tax=Streptomyces jeddahensis TaxID=1716141 RepID=A0A177HIF8_9ACTN|nr:hypothetical protein STSP_59830 [Streptomyces jeddahensis]
MIDSLATLDASKSRITLALVNRDPASAIACDVRISGHPVDGSHQATVLEGPHADAYNDVDQPDTITPRATKVEFRSGRVVLPSHSLTMCHIELPVHHAEGEVNAGRMLSGDWHLSTTGWHKRS